MLIDLHANFKGYLDNTLLRRFGHYSMSALLPLQILFWVVVGSFLHTIRIAPLNYKGFPRISPALLSNTNGAVGVVLVANVSLAFRSQ